MNHLTLSLTQRCNLNCIYCRQPRAGTTMARSVLNRAVDFFVPFLNTDSSIGFYGGEPLLAFNHIVDVVDRIPSDISGNRSVFTLTTNGTLITPGIVDFLNHHEFTVLLSWDGPLQESQRGSAEAVSKAMEALRDHSRIRLETNTVVTPTAVPRLAEVLMKVYRSGIRHIHFSPDRSVAWSGKALSELDNQLKRINTWMADLPSTSLLPVVTLRPRSATGPFACPAATDRLAISATGEVWGCFRFHDYFDDGQIHMQRDQYCFGTLDAFIAHFPDSLRDRRNAYMRLRPAYYSNPAGLCLGCRETQSCTVCPVPFGDGLGVGHIPASTCRIQSILNRRRRDNQITEKNRKDAATAPCD